MKVLYAASEALPFMASGGLGDVAGSLPQALRKRLIGCRVVMPLYDTIKQELKDTMKFITHISVPVAWRRQYCGIFEAKHNGVIYYLIDNQYYFKRDTIYGHYDDAERFAFFSRAILEIIPYIDFKPDIIHCNDWQTALLPLFLKTFYQSLEAYRPIRTMFTIHNIEYQGQAPVSFATEVLGLPESRMADIMYGGCLNFVFSAICLADKVTTVSQSYAEELKTAYYGGELSGVLAGVSYKFCGITNGIDTDLFNPHTDRHLFHRYDVKTMAGKKIGKRKLREQLGLAQEDDVPIVSMISRLVGHKGLDLVEYVRDEMMQRRMQLIVLGTGESAYENMFRELSYRYPDRVSANIRFDTDLANKIYAASDLFLMPSKSEPCGLSQMIAMRYGALPIVRETGGLKDTVWPIDPNTGEGRGFTFKSYNAHDMLDAFDRALWFYYEKKPELKKVIRSNMQADFSWHNAAAQYMAIYRSM